MVAILPIIFLLVVLIAFLAWRSHQRTVQMWNEVARELGLGFQVGSGISRPVLTGAIGGLPVHIDTYVQRSGNNSTTYTRYRVTYPHLGFELQLKRQGAFAAITKLFGAQDVEIGDSLFDETFVVKTNNPNRLRALLTPSVRTGLLRLVASYSGVVISDDNITFSKTGFESNRDRLKSTIQRLAATARLLSSPDAGVSDDMVVDREQGLLDDVAGRIRERIEAEPDDVDQRIFEVETLAAAGREAAAAERLAELEQIAPADPDVVGWREALQTQRVSHDNTVDVDTLATDLFGGDDLSFETRAKFNTTYADAPIRWQGRVENVDRGQLTITVATVNNDLYGNTEISVVVENPSGRTRNEGETVTVSGTLETIDPLLRNLFVADATLS
ncbi:MAG: hypothetical protein QNJ89_07120 [Acidimicrobiia bacterium]|nr:hypothetical protein [Acidimicrobiia bacterium]